MSELGRLVLAEWTKFRTVRGWVLGTVAAGLVTVLLGIFVASNSHSVCSNGTVDIECPTPPVGPDGEPVRDKFFFVHQPLAGDGVITVRVTSMTGIITYPPPRHDEIVPGLVEWAKAVRLVGSSRVSKLPGSDGRYGPPGPSGLSGLSG